MTRPGADPGVVTETALPGIGIRYEFVTQDGDRIGVVHHRSGVRELVRYERDDPDTSHDLLRLGPEDSRTLAELLGVSQVAKDLAAKGEIMLAGSGGDDELIY